MKEIKLGAYIRNGETYNFNLATDLSAYEKTVFVRTVVDTLVDQYNYDYIIKDIIFDFTIITMFTDIDTSFIKQVDDEGKEISALILIEQFLNETNVVDIVKANMEVGLLEKLEEAVNKSIEYRTGIHPSPIADSIASLLSTLEKKIGEIDLGKAMEMAQMFTGMTEDFTPESLVNAYMNSDMHKKNVEEIAESKKQKAEFAEDLDKAIKIVGRESESKQSEN